MYTNSIADHMRVAKHLAPAGYLQAHAFNLDGNRFARRLRKLLLHMADELFGGALSPSFWWDLALAASARKRNVNSCGFLFAEYTMKVDPKSASSVTAVVPLLHTLGARLIRSLPKKWSWRSVPVPIRRYLLGRQRYCHYTNTP